ncbi:MAG: helix-turn-helix domain-containing protein [Clostridiaceae bacterium]|nr:helix-turn-helix domain-containing protein [Clostridiaceae bacterium]
MEIIDILQNSLDYIEMNLKTEISLAELATAAGFSLYHYCRIFTSYVGYPVAAYTTKRRLCNAIFELQQGKETLEIALEYGFSTYAGFFKAFKKEYGCSPTSYIKIVSVKKPMPIDLKQEVKIMLTHTQIKQILLNWDIDRITPIEETELLTSEGYSKANKTWYINEDYILKSGKDINRINTHISITKTLEASGLIVSTHIPTKTGEDFLQKDNCYYLLMKRIPGSLLTPKESYEGNRLETGREYGKAVGILHKALKKYDKDIEVNVSNLYKTCIEWALPETKRLMKQWKCPLPDEFFDNYIEEFGKLYEKLPTQIIHRDPNPSNILWKDGKVIGFLDFEISEGNIRLFDPCYCATGILSEASSIVRGYELWPELLSGIIKGYDEICTLTKEEKLAIPYIVYSIQMIFIAYLDSQTKDKLLGEINRNMLTWLWNNRKTWHPMYT